MEDDAEENPLPSDGRGELTVDDVQHVASLARVELDQREAEEFVDEFNDVLDYFDVLDEVEDDVEPRDDLSNVVRADEVETSLSREGALANAPRTEDGYVRGPRVS